MSYFAHSLPPVPHFVRLARHHPVHLWNGGSPYRGRFHGSSLPRCQDHLPSYTDMGQPYPTVQRLGSGGEAL